MDYIYTLSVQAHWDDSQTTLGQFSSSELAKEYAEEHAIKWGVQNEPIEQWQVYEAENYWHCIGVTGYREYEIERCELDPKYIDYSNLEAKDGS